MEMGRKKHLQNNIFLTLIFLPLKTQRPSGNLATKKNHTKMKYSFHYSQATHPQLLLRCFLTAVFVTSLTFVKNDVLGIYIINYTP